MNKKLPPALLPTLSLSTGIVLASVGALSWWWGVIFIAFALLGYLLILRQSSDPVRAFKAAKLHAVWVVSLFLGIGMLDEYCQHPLTLEDACKGEAPTLISGEVVNILPKTYGDRLEVVLDGTNGAKVQIRTGATTLSNGDIICFPVSYLKEISSDTGSVSKKLAPMLKSHGILYTAFVPTKYISHQGHSKSFRSLCAKIRNEIEIKIERSHLQKETADFIKAILMGDKAGLDEETRLTFANGGIAHMLALSGLHMGIIAGMLMWLMWPLRAAGKYKWGYAVSILLLWCYVFITGMSHSSVRACIMITFAFLAIVMERKNAVGHALSSACLLILLVSPSAFFDAGFQLSVVCVASLIAFSSRLNPIRHRQHPRLFRICEALLATMVATAASWAFISYYFSQVPLMFLPTNLLLLPIIPIYLCLSIIFTALLCIGWGFNFLGTILDHAYRSLLWGADTLSSGGNYILEYQIPLYGLITWIFLLSLAAFALNRKS